MRKELPNKEMIDTLPPDGGEEFNRLIHSTSPYLRQHARNPVDWYPWGDEAFEKAKAENKPVFLSVGYSSCHWCHVMEHESFEDDEVAQLLNTLYVPIKVDREERPDLDAIYMNATQIMTRRGGWPNSLWLDADARPWYAGTYFPKDDQHGRPGFINMLTQLHKAWVEQPEAISKQADELTEIIQRLGYQEKISATESLDRGVIQSAIKELESSFDAKLGGFGGAPKFPPHQSLNLLLDEYERSGNQGLLNMISTTLDAMALGGIYDHVGGGFARYSTDEKWFLPHFEKMLYDNGQLLSVYARAYKLTGNPLYEKVSRGIASWVLRDMSNESGGFYSALDADSEGVEGKYYVWTYEEIIELLGEEDGLFILSTFNCTKEGTYVDEAHGTKSGANLFYLVEYDTEKSNRASPLLEKLRLVREKRIPPALDDKVLTAWNGLMISGLAIAGKALQEPAYISAAEKNAAFILSQLKKEDRLLRSYREGKAGLNAYLDDYAFLAKGFLDLYLATDDIKWAEECDKLIETLDLHYSDKEQGGYFFTSHDHEQILSRSKDPYDSAIPSGNGILCEVLAKLYKKTNEPRYLQKAEHSFSFFEPLIVQSPQAAMTFLIAYNQMPEKKAEPVAAESSTASKGPLTVQVKALKAKAGQKAALVFNLTLKDGYHINATPPSMDYLIPTVISLAKNDHATLADVTYPKGHEFSTPAFEKPVFVYGSGDQIKAVLEISAEARGDIPLKFNLGFQACDDSSCLPPDELILETTLVITE